MIRKLAGIAAAAALLAGCGGSASEPSSTSEGASFAPGKVAAYATVDTDVESSQWKKAEALLDKFPGKADLLSELRSNLSKEGVDWERDVKPALGNEVDLVWLDFGNGGENAVGFTKPKDKAKLDALLEKGSQPNVHEEIDGWTVFASHQQQLDRFEQLRDDGGSLADDDAFKAAVDGLPDDTLASAFVRGSDVERALVRSISSTGVPSSLRNSIGRLDAIGAAVTAESSGIRFDATLKGDLKGGSSTYHAELPSSLAAGAVAYVSFRDLAGPLQRVLDSAENLSPGFAQQRAQIEAALGMSLKDDVLPLFSGEGALALYPTASGAPEVVFAAKVSDEAKARRLLDRLAALAALSGGSYSAKRVQIGNVGGLELSAESTTVFAAAFDGKLVISNLRSGIEDVQGSGSKLAGDSAFESALSGADVPDETAGFFYSDLRGGLRYLFSYLEGQGETIPRDARENLAPLRGLLMYWTKDGDRFAFTGFLGIE